MRGKDRFHLHSLVLKQSISGFGFSAALTSLRNIGCGLRIEIPRHGKQPLPMTPVAQPRTAELLFGPIPWWLGGLGADCGRTTRRTGLLAQTLLTVGPQRVEINVFDRFVLAVFTILTTATAGLAHVYPISRTVRSGGKTFRFNVGLQQKRLITIRLCPILWQAFLCASANALEAKFLTRTPRAITKRELATTSGR